MDTDVKQSPKLPPVWFKHAFWHAHRALYKLGRDRVLWTPASKRGWGALRLTTVGRKTGIDRTVIVGYLEDGPDLVVLAMNGWDAGYPSWWLNLQDHPEAVVHVKGRPPQAVRAARATGAERERLWQRWLAIEPEDAAFASLRSVDTPVVVLQPAAPTVGG